MTLIKGDLTQPLITQTYQQSGGIRAHLFKTPKEPHIRVISHPIPGYKTLTPPTHTKLKLHVSVPFSISLYLYLGVIRMKCGHEVNISQYLMENEPVFHRYLLADNIISAIKMSVCLSGFKRSNFYHKIAYNGLSVCEHHFNFWIMLPLNKINLPR